MSHFQIFVFGLYNSSLREEYDAWVKLRTQTAQGPEKKKSPTNFIQMKQKSTMKDYNFFFFFFFEKDERLQVVCDYFNFGICWKGEIPF